MVTIVVTAVALVAGNPQSARAESVNITETTITAKTGDPSKINFSNDSWTLSFCSKSKAAKKSYVQVKSGKKWKKLTKVSKTKTVKNISQCKKSYPYLTKFTYTETKASKRQYRVYVPGQSGYKPHFKVSKKLASSGGPIGGLSKLENCKYKGKDLYGSVYFSPYSFDADFKVYVSDFSFNSDLNVYSTPYSFSATSCGLWYETPYSFNADFIVYVTPFSFDADFKIYYTDFSFSAGVK